MHENVARLACLPEILDLADLAAAMGVTRDGARRMVARGEVPGAKIGRCWRIRRVALLEAIEAREVAPPAARPVPPPARAEILALLAGRRGGAK